MSSDDDDAESSPATAQEDKATSPAKNVLHDAAAAAPITSKETNANRERDCDLLVCHQTLVVEVTNPGPLGLSVSHITNNI